MSKKRILQIANADPRWRAIFKGDSPCDPGEHIACWALVEETDERGEVYTYVDAVAGTEDKLEPLMLCGDVGNFAELVFVDEGAA